MRRRWHIYRYLRANMRQSRYDAWVTSKRYALHYPKVKR